MVFSSMLFVFLFLSLNLLSQILLKGNPRRQNIAMLIFSLVFYSWSGVRYLLLLLLMVLICWGGALRITKDPERKKPAMILTVTLCLLILGIFKYTGFFLTNLKALIGVPKVIPQIVLPIGISFYTFQLISYVVDVYRGEVPAQKKYWLLLLYASLFHQCIAGPIVRYKDVENDIKTRKIKKSEISRGISRFSIGLAKKAVLANGCAVVADTIFTSSSTQLASQPVLGILLGALAFTLQIYLDFSAYSDMAIGMGLMCGFHYRENFNYPYIANSITDFWRRWHISLSTFFRDYIYIPLGGSRCSKNRQIFNLFVVWGLTGMWHGASWNYIFWGLYFGVLLCIERYVIGDHMSKIPAAVRHILVLLLVMISWILFKFTDFSQLGIVFKGLFGLNHNGFTSASVRILFKNNVFFLLFCLVAVTPFGKELLKSIKHLGRTNDTWFWIGSVWEVLHPVVLLFISAMALTGASYNPFLYFQF